MKKAKFGMSALLLIGIIYSILGGVFAALGIGLLVALRDLDMWPIGVIFSGIGGVFLILGILFLTIELSKKRRADRLLAAGRYIWGELIDLVPNYNVRIQNRHPYYAVVRYTDGRGVNHIFRSASLKLYPDPALKGKQVKVYIQDNTYRHYYVDMDELLPQYVEH